MSQTAGSRKLVIATVGLLACMVTIAVCCDTPVYRFAMYNWAPTPYEVYYFYSEEVPKDDKAVNDALRKSAEGDTRTNLAFLPFDLSDDPDLTKTPILPQVREAWLKKNDNPKDGYLIVGPRGAVLHRGPLAAKELKSLAQSKKRTQLAKNLELGHACVFVMLPGKDDKQNAVARQALDRVVAEIKSGKLNLYKPPAKGGAFGAQTPDKDPLAEDNEDKSKKADKTKVAAGAKDDKKKGDDKKDGPKTEVSILVVDRSSPEEAWFVKNLLSLEDDLKDLSEPMVFPVYGRARALLPMVGKGIHYDNLVASVEFVSGACSCEIKDENPGVDLLIRFDWEAAAGKVAEKFGKEEGNENRFAGDDLFPEILIPANPADDAKKGQEKPPAKDPKSNQLEKAQGQPNVADVAKDTGDPSETDTNLVANKKDAATTPAKNDSAKEDAAQGDESVAMVPNNLEDDGSGSSDAGAASVSGIMIIGTGIGLALLLLMVATLVIMRPRG